MIAVTKVADYALKVIEFNEKYPLKGSRGKEQGRRPVGGLQEGHGGQTQAEAEIRRARQSDVDVVLGAQETGLQSLRQIDAAAVHTTAQYCELHFRLDTG